MVVTRLPPAPGVKRLRARISDGFRRRLSRPERARPWLLVASGILATLVSVSAMWGFNLLLQFAEHPVRKVAGLDESSEFATHPRNVLLLGSDTRAGLSEEERAAFGSEDGERSDTIILLHIDPRRDQAVVVHLPRDLRLTIPGHGLDKINAAYELGGPSLVVQTVKRFTGLPIHNYIEVDMAGFQRLVDALGGVRMCVDRPMYDPDSALALPKAGCYLFDGTLALAFVRARGVEGDLIPDFNRIARQQQFMRALMNRMLSLGALLDTQVIEEAMRNVTTDERLSGADLVLLGQKLRELASEDPSGARSLDFRVLPSIPQTIDGVSYVIAQQPETDQLLEALQLRRPLGKLGLTLAHTLPSPGVISVRVLRVGISPEAEEVEDLLRRAGFIVLEAREAPPGTVESEILFRPGAGPRAQVVSGYFENLPRRPVSASILGGTEVAVVVADDFGSVVPS